MPCLAAASVPATAIASARPAAIGRTGGSVSVKIPRPQGLKGRRPLHGASPRIHRRREYSPAAAGSNVRSADVGPAGGRRSQPPRSPASARHAAGAARPSHGPRVAAKLAVRWPLLRYTSTSPITLGQRSSRQSTSVGSSTRTPSTVRTGLAHRLRPRGRPAAGEGAAAQLARGAPRRTRGRRAGRAAGRSPRRRGPPSRAAGAARAASPPRARARRRRRRAACRRRGPVVRGARRQHERRAAPRARSGAARTRARRRTRG